ncbi:MAG: Brp/Blh family beta-carotene 15,15'-dioxygenase [Bdellovibrionaceae bacterium]|nr:Brp/Blh family beta-carotene 15,15'-dioxygenase [Bdellovibrio sp.]
MKFIKIQGIAFCALAFLFAILASTTALLSDSTEVVFLAIMIATLGLPHGALDTLFAKNRFHLNSLKRWLIFILIYLSIAVFFLQIWKVFPLLFLVTFLIISVFHFSQDPVSNPSFTSRILYGGSIVFLPTLLHADEVLRIFSFLVKIGDARPLVDGLHIIAWPWALGLFTSCLLRLKKDWLSAIEMISVGLLATYASPLTAFTVFFCGMHSARHIIRMSELTKSLTITTFRIFLAASTLPTLAVSLVGAVVWLFPTESSFDARVVQIVFVGLAALTVPHMVLLDGSNFHSRKSV